ncbi:hypothetical protein Tco_0285995 [Tanacetum coccineum]
MCTYLKNMEGYKLKDLKSKGFDSIQEMFDRAFKRQKVDDDKETAKLKQCLEIIPDDEEGRIVGIKSLLDAVRIIAAQVYVNTTLMKLVLLMNFKEITLSCFTTLTTTAGTKVDSADVKVYYC